MKTLVFLFLAFALLATDAAAQGSPGPQPGPNVGDAVSIPIASSIFPGALSLDSSARTILTLSGGVPGGTLTRVNLASGAVDPIALAGFISRGLALNRARTAAFITGTTGQPFFGFVRKVDLDTRVVSDVALTQLGLIGIALESNDETALVTSKDGKSLFRVNLSSGAISLVSDQVPVPIAVAVERDGVSALVAGTGALWRVDLQNGGVTPIAINLGIFGPDPPTGGLALEPGGETALLAVSQGLLRVNLGTHEVSTVFSSTPPCGYDAGLVIEAGGETALVSSRDCGIIRVRIKPGQPNLVVNGSFEEPRIAQNAFALFTSITGWQLSFGFSCGIEIQSGIAGTPQHGSQFVELDSLCSSGIFQDLPTIPGQVYELRFFFSPRPISIGAPGGVADNRLVVKWNDAVVVELAASGAGLLDTVWTEFVYRLTATSAMTRLQFGDASISDSFGTYIDNVRLVTAGPLSFSEVVQTSVTVEVGPGSSIRGTFRPNFGLTLEQAAQLGGYHHFNWLSVVTKDTILTFFPFLALGLVNESNFLPTVPYIDPPHGGYLYQVIDCSQSNPGVCFFPVADNLDWYLDEEFTETYVRGHPTQLERNSAPLNGTFTSLDFLDSPSTTLGGDLAYRTFLVGVMSGGRGRILDIEGTWFNWTVTGTLFGSDVAERRSNFDPALGSGRVEFAGFSSPGSFSQAELELFARAGIELQNAEGVVKPVAIDIKPGDSQNPVNPRSHGRVPVAILSTSTFDAVSQVDQTSLTFGRTGSESSLAFCNAGSEDVNADGVPDLVCHFKTEATGFRAGDARGTLKGQTVNGISILGVDLIRIVGF